MTTNQPILSMQEATNARIQQMDQRLTERLDSLTEEIRALAGEVRGLGSELREFANSLRHQERNIERLCNAWDTQLQLQATTVAALSKAVESQSAMADKLIAAMQGNS